MTLRPRNDFKVYRTCPEIRSYIRRVYGWALLRTTIAILFFLVRFPFLGVSMVLGILSAITQNNSDKIAELGEWVISPLFVREQAEIRKAHEILPVAEIQARTPNLHLRF